MIEGRRACERKREKLQELAAASLGSSKEVNNIYNIQYYQFDYFFSPNKQSQEKHGDDDNDK